MFINLEMYRAKKICAAVSGGKDSMALLHILIENHKKFQIELSALNCDHGIRGEQSKKDSEFVAEYCKLHGVPLLRFCAQGFASEEAAREWRTQCYLKAAEYCDCVATAHHMDDNAETVLFNLARGASLSGMQGIQDRDLSARAGKPFSLIRPLISCSRKQIDEYISLNNIPFVQDESNFTDDYTRNKIRHNVLPELERAVNGATGAIYRFSRRAAEDEEYFARQTEKFIDCAIPEGYFIFDCPEKVIFRRAAAHIIARKFGRKDYTAEMLERLFDLQNAPVGKMFEFLGITAFKERGRIALCEQKQALNAAYVPLNEASDRLLTLNGISLFIGVEKSLTRHESELLSLYGDKIKTLRLDADKLPENAVIRLMQSGDEFEKFGGGTKKLGDYLTDKKIPLRLRKVIPLICDGAKVLAVCGIEIADGVKTDASTKRVLHIVAPDFGKL